MVRRAKQFCSLSVLFSVEPIIGESSISEIPIQTFFSSVHGARIDMRLANSLLSHILAPHFIASIHGRMSVRIQSKKLKKCDTLGRGIDRKWRHSISFPRWSGEKRMRWWWRICSLSIPNIPDSQSQILVQNFDISSFMWLEPIGKIKTNWLLAPDF